MAYKLEYYLSGFMYIHAYAVKYQFFTPGLSWEMTQPVVRSYYELDDGQYATEMFFILPFSVPPEPLMEFAEITYIPAGNRVYIR